MNDRRLRQQVLALYSRLPLRVRLYSWLRIRMLAATQLSDLLPRQGLLVDVGCGAGVIAHYLALAAPGREVLGIDANTRRIHYAQQAADSQPHTTFLAADVMSGLPECDAVLMSDFLHHLTPDDQDRLLRRVSEQLRTGGTLLIADVNPAHPQRWRVAMSWLADTILYPFSERNNFRHPGPFTRFLTDLGFRVTQAERPSTLFAGIIYVCRAPN